MNIEQILMTVRPAKIIYKDAEGILTITENGTYNIRGYEFVQVDVNE